MSNNPTTDRLDAIRQRHAVLAARKWSAKPHQHAASGCRCLSCDDDPTGWQVDHPSALDCEELVASTTNDFGRERGSCDAGPLLSHEEAAALSRAADDIGFLLDQLAAASSAVPVPPATHATDLRDRIAAALLARIKQATVSRARPHDAFTSLLAATEYDLADAVLAVLPPPAARAAVLLEASAVADRIADAMGKDEEAWASRAKWACATVGVQLRRMADETQASWTPGPVAVARAAEWASQQRAATVDPAMCPRCRGDNSEAFELCAACATTPPAVVAEPGKENDDPRTVCVCGHTRGEHAVVGGPFGRGRLLCDECNGLDGGACKEFEAL